MHLEKFIMIVLVLGTLALSGARCRLDLRDFSKSQSSTNDAGMRVGNDATILAPNMDAGETTNVPDAGHYVIPPDWQTYNNQQWNVSIVYPAGWYYRERAVEETNNTRRLWVDFNREQILIIPEADAVYPITLIVTKNTTLTYAKADYFVGGNAQEELVTINGVTFTKVTYSSDLLDGALITVFLYEHQGTVYEVSGQKDLPELLTIVSSLTT